MRIKKIIGLIFLIIALIGGIHTKITNKIKNNKNSQEQVKELLKKNDR